MTQVAWADVASGAVLATSCGYSVSIWREASGGSQTPSWQLQATLPDVVSPVTDLRFAPHGHGELCLAATSANGTVRLHSPSVPEPDGGIGWGLQSELWPADGRSSGAVTCLAWRPPSPGAPAMLLVGSAAGAVAWWHDTPHGRWAVTAQLPGPPADAVAWAAVLGRPSELVAVASGHDITVWSLFGPADALQAEKVAELTAAAAVHQLEFNSLGSWLAASNSEGQVQLWRPALDGTWNLLSSVQGRAGEEQLQISG